MDQNDPAYGTEKSPSSREVKEREALREAIAEQVARNQGVQPQLDAIAAILKQYAPEILKMKLLRGDFPMKVTGNIVSIDESVLNTGNQGNNTLLIVDNGFARFLNNVPGQKGEYLP